MLSWSILHNKPEESPRGTKIPRWSILDILKWFITPNEWPWVNFEVIFSIFFNLVSWSKMSSTLMNSAKSSLFFVVQIQFRHLWRQIKVTYTQNICGVLSLLGQHTIWESRRRGNCKLPIDVFKMFEKDCFRQFFLQTFPEYKKAIYNMVSFYVNFV